jgi:hypothetical protein
MKHCYQQYIELMFWQAPELRLTLPSFCSPGACVMSPLQVRVQTDLHNSTEVPPS